MKVLLVCLVAGLFGTTLAPKMVLRKSSYSGQPAIPKSVGLKNEFTGIAQVHFQKILLSSKHRPL